MGKKQLLASSLILEVKVMINLTLLTGPSGSGNSSAKYVFEELGYYVSENVPGSLVLEMISHFENNKYKCKNFCVIINVKDALDIYEELKNIKNINLRLVVLFTEEEELLKRYTLTRHVHPRTRLVKISLEDAIKDDVKDTLELIPEADIYIDTTSLTVKELRTILYQKLDEANIHITNFTFISYGLKNGTPSGLDLSFDVRIIPNPYWVDELKELNGLDPKVVKYMTSFPITQKLLDELVTYLSFYFEEVVKLGRANYNVGIACSGGYHRSTFVANYLYNYFKNKYKTTIIHRDCPELNKID